LVDPGEYGVESYSCRLACCFIFMISCMGEFVVTCKMAQLIWKIPTRAEPWIEPKVDEQDESAHLLGAIDEVRITIAGMPFIWKVINMVMVVIPKFFLWRLTAGTGITVLMETSGIDDIITNSVRLTFILSLDELIGLALLPEETLNFVQATETFALFDRTTSCVGDMAKLEPEELLRVYGEKQFGICSWGLVDIIGLFPPKLIMSIVATAIFVWEYYHKHCIVNKDDDHRLISRTVYLPATSEFGWLNAFWPSMWPIELSETPAWQMPASD